MEENIVINAANEAVVNTFQMRTDLALEQRESSMGGDGDVLGVRLKEWYHQKSGLRLTGVEILNERGAESMGKPRGAYLTLEADRLSKADDDYHSEISEKLACQIQKLTAEATGYREKDLPSILVVGLGNDSVTSGSLGPRVLDSLQVTGHLDGQYGNTFLKDRELPIISGIAPRTMAQTGVETVEISRGIIHKTHPDLIIAIGALAARSVRRLGTIIQLADTGIHPGSRVGDHHHSLAKESPGVLVMAIGVPAVMRTVAIVHGTVSTLVRVLAENGGTGGARSWIEKVDPDEQHQLIRELLESGSGPLYVIPPDIDQSVE